MAVTIAQALPIVASYLNATTTDLNASSLSTVINDHRHPKSEIVEAILEADGEVCRAIINSENHPRRNLFASKQQVLTYGDDLPTCTDGYGSVEVLGNDNVWRMGSSRSVTHIERVRANPSLFGGNAGSQKYFNTSNGNAYFTGQGIRFDVYNYVRGSECQSPDEYLTAVVFLALGALMGKEGDDTNTAQYYRQKGEQQIAMAMQDQSPTEFEQYQAAKARGVI